MKTKNEDSSAFHTTQIENTALFEVLFGRERYSRTINFEERSLVPGPHEFEYKLCVFFDVRNKSVDICEQYLTMFESHNLRFHNQFWNNNKNKLILKTECDL